MNRSSIPAISRCVQALRTFEKVAGTFPVKVPATYLRFCTPACSGDVEAIDIETWC